MIPKPPLHSKIEKQNIDGTFFFWGLLKTWQFIPKN
jgi:hypothetical protein